MQSFGKKLCLKIEYRPKKERLHGPRFALLFAAAWIWIPQPCKLMLADWDKRNKLPTRLLGKDRLTLLTSRECPRCGHLTALAFRGRVALVIVRQGAYRIDTERPESEVGRDSEGVCAPCCYRYDEVVNTFTVEARTLLKAKLLDLAVLDPRVSGLR